MGIMTAVQCDVEGCQEYLGRNVKDASTVRIEALRQGWLVVSDYTATAKYYICPLCSDRQFKQPIEMEAL